MVFDKYDSPDGITSVELIIQAISGNTSPVIYANGRNQLPVEIIVKALREDDEGNETILNFSHDTWIHILNLRHAESDKKLTWQGNSGWCFTASDNGYSREVHTFGMDHAEIPPSVRLTASGQTLITLFVYTNDVSTRRIAVSLDTDGGKHFTTADNAFGAEKSSLSVRAIQPLVYSRNDISVDLVTELGRSKATVKIKRPTYDWKTYYIDSHYDNFYITSNKAQIKKYNVYGYGSGGEYPLRVAAYWTHKNDQHMLIANPSNLNAGQDTLGFYGNASWSYDNFWASYHLFQTFRYNERANTVCWTHFSFAASQHWPLPDNVGLHVNDTSHKSYFYDSWFDFYDIYGNYGRYTIRYNPGDKEIQISQR